MGMPRTLKAWNIFFEGKSWAGEASEIELPKLTKKTDDHQGAGMIAPVSIPLGYEKLELSFSADGILMEAEKAFRDCGVSKHQLRFSGAYQDDETCMVTAGDIIVRGMFVERDAGTAKPGEKNTRKYTMHLSYYKEVCNGETIHLIDAFNPVSGAVAGVNAIAAAVGI